ncbi:diuretic hormone 45 isoform X1 [Danaus plexippus]|uniref:diuretic hormone 45 isoform X1 n=1 Tax=Danaus plexippus TaxID=13037 RepID=UPI0013C4108D|nr:diuretic hormone 45 isoform X1 [Danaus plexippus]XP_061382865.1 diuretic hormone 45 isoform X1 [Danaus plexippus]
MMWCAVWCALMMAGSVWSETVPSTNGLAQPIDWAQLDSSLPDDESVAYASPMGGRYASAPWVYLLAEVPRDTQRYPDLREGRSRPKRKMPSLSINNPMEVLRQRLLLEVARKQMREANQRQAVANRVFLQNVGKRGFWGDSGSFRYDN